VRINHAVTALLVAAALSGAAIVGGVMPGFDTAADQARPTSVTGLAQGATVPDPAGDDLAPAYRQPRPTAGETPTAKPHDPGRKRVVHAAEPAGPTGGQAGRAGRLADRVQTSTRNARHRHHSPSADPIDQTVRLAQANIKQGSPTFATDLAIVASHDPDFITLNEAGYRTDVQIRPAGYDSYRSMVSPFTRETPVLWRTDRWTKVGAGTRWLTVRHVTWGERAVNWVTLRSTSTGQVVSVVSAHPAPTTRATQGLLPVFATRLVSLVRTLEAHGPVLIGGDFNAQYAGHLYPGAILAGGGLTPTYATFGMPAGGTGDHFGATIDYLFYTAGLTPTAQSKAELNSDHDAVFGTFALSD
jgi:endonuclease/exonuclease/phosphatase (EEP) superfamily protein YafD